MIFFSVDIKAALFFHTPFEARLFSQRIESQNFLKSCFKPKVFIPPQRLKRVMLNLIKTIKLQGALSKHFTSITHSLISRHTGNHDPDLGKLSEFVSSKVPPENFYRIPPVHTTFAHKYLSTIDSSKATGLDELGARILKLSAPYIAHSITRIRNLSMEAGKFPEQWKLARVAPLFKNRLILVTIDQFPFYRYCQN